MKHNGYAYYRDPMEEPDYLEDDEQAAHREADAARKSADPRDKTPDPPAILSPLSVLKMQRMVKDAATHGDRPWPYQGAA